MKLSTTVSALILSALASSSGADARNAGSRRSVQLNNVSAPNLVKRVSLAQMKESSADNMQKKVKRQPLPNAAPIAAAAGFGAIPSMNDGNMPIVGLSKRQHSFDEHNGKQGTAVTSNNVVSSSNNSGSSSSTSSDSSDADAEECEEDDGDDDDEDCEEDDGSADDDDEECEEDDSADDEDCEEDDSADDEECEDDGDDDEEDCTEEDGSDSSDSTSSSTDDTAVAATANVNVNLKQSNDNNKSNGNNNGDSSSSSSSSNNNNDKWGMTQSSSSSPAASKTSSSASSKKTESSSSSPDGESYTGIATWYTQNGNAGACGTVNPDSAKIIALYTSAYANGDNCGRSVVIKNLDDGTQTTATVADMCPSCGGPQDIDLSVGAFEAIDPEYQTHGVRNIEWYFTD